MKQPPIYVNHHSLYLNSSFLPETFSDYHNFMVFKNIINTIKFHAYMGFIFIFLFSAPSSTPSILISLQLLTPPEASILGVVFINTIKFQALFFSFRGLKLKDNEIKNRTLERAIGL